MPASPSFDFAKLLRSPWTTILSAALGIYIGTLNKGLAEWIAPIGTLYLGLLKMCVLPILMSAIMTSIGRLMTSKNAGDSIRRILIVFPIGLLLVSTIATAIAVIAGPGRNLPTSTLEALGVLVNQSKIDFEIALTGAIAPEETFNATQFINSLVPDNIFNALSEGQTLKVLIFSIIFGVSLGLVKDAIANSFFDWLETVYKTFSQLIRALTLMLPFGLCSLLAEQFSQMSLVILLAMLKFVVVAIGTFLLIYVLSTLVIWRKTGLPLIQVLIALKESTILALATTSSLACIPSAISTLSNDLQFKRQTTTLVTPLSITICRFGSVAYFALAATFVAQLYGKELSVGTLVITILGSVLAGMATSGVTGVLTLTMMDLVLAPLKLPLEAVLVLFIAVDPLMDPFRTVGIVQTGMAATAAIAPLKTAAQAYPHVASSERMGTDPGFINNISFPERTVLRRQGTGI
ncbi:MAG: dicarboxylate/amino acid:cation symporter [Oculatellaceae cyanobacterium Prado106]|jgi:Na+/H+-dicarboxylate symporter|nr:dicarboxylate/amino acid:cation symporter [Oculatellaceae cyanobacterium Prado106]